MDAPRVVKETKRWITIPTIEETNEANAKDPNAPYEPITERLSSEQLHERIANYKQKYGSLVKSFAGIAGRLDSMTFVKKNSDFIAPEAVIYATKLAGDLAEKRQFKEMEVALRQCVSLQYIIDMSRTKRVHPRRCAMTFFEHIANEDSEYSLKFKDSWTNLASDLKQKVLFENEPEMAQPAATKSYTVIPNMANAFKTDAAKSDSAKPDSAKPDSAKQDSAKQDSAKPNSAKPDSAKPNSAKLDSAKSAAAKPDAVQPNSAKKLPAKPKATKSETFKSKVSTSSSVTSELGNPIAAESEASTPELISPKEQLKKLPLGPGGLDPNEVFKQLPEPMKNCFSTGNANGLRQILSKMPQAEATYYMHRCIGSGLWSPNPKKSPKK